MNANECVSLSLDAVFLSRKLDLTLELIEKDASDSQLEELANILRRSRVLMTYLGQSDLDCYGQGFTRNPELINLMHHARTRIQNAIYSAKGMLFSRVLNHEESIKNPLELLQNLIYLKECLEKTKKQLFKRNIPLIGLVLLKIRLLKPNLGISELKKANHFLSISPHRSTNNQDIQEDISRLAVQSTFINGIENTPLLKAIEMISGLQVLVEASIRSLNSKLEEYFLMRLNQNFKPIN